MHFLLENFSSLTVIIIHPYPLHGAVQKEEQSVIRAKPVALEVCFAPTCGGEQGV
jgi:hypothetical protein